MNNVLPDIGDRQRIARFCSGEPRALRRCFALLSLLLLPLGESLAALVPFIQTSDPAGLVDIAAVVDTGTQVATTNAPDVISGYRFAYWTRNAVGQRDLLGRALNPLNILLLEGTTATAHYRLETDDTNTNAIPDWWELNFHSNLLSDVASDKDADTLDELEEYRRDYHPGLKDEIREGGISVSFDSPRLVIVGTNWASYAVGSDPAGLVPALEIVTNKGSVCLLPDSYGVVSGQRFAYWTVNGVIQTDQLGRALGGLGIVLQSNTVAQAVFIPESADTNTNGIPDWYEWHFEGGLSAAFTNDTDGDGFDLLEEYRRDYHPGLKDEIREGGVSVSFDSARLAIVGTNWASYSVSSAPAGLVPALEIVTNKGTVCLLPDSYGVVSGQRFAYWTVNGAIQTDQLGRALGGLGIALQSNTVAQAVFIPESADTNTNGIPDWYEWHFGGGLSAAFTNDTDGDGFDLLEEYRRDYHPGLKDEIREGGISVSFDSARLVIVDTNWASYSVSSDPAGLVPALEIVTNKGTVCSLPDSYGVASGQRFAYWTVNGAIQTDQLGRALGGASISLQSNTVAQAVFIPESADTNTNGIPDWYEWHFEGGLSAAFTNDTDGDGFDLLEEYRRDYHPGLRDEIREGGISMSTGPGADVSFGFFPRVSDCLVGGVMARAFSLAPPGTGAVAMAGASRPAVGDWDGDGDLDLFVGGQGGAMRVFENAGSPVVLNLVDRTTNFAGMASYWTAVARPAPALGDWNGDGAADLAVGGATGVLFLIASTTNFLSPQTPVSTGALDVGGTLAMPAFADANGDGRVDLLVLRSDGTVNAYTNSGIPSAPYTADHVLSNVLALVVPEATGICGADVTGDGIDDVLVSDASGSIWEFDGDGAGHFAVKSKVFGGGYAGFADGLSVTAGDLDGDGNADMLGGYDQGGLVYLRNPAARLLVSPPSVTVLAGQEAAFTALGATNVAWSFLLNRSGGALNATTGVYKAGAVGGGIDVIEGSDTNGLRGRSYVNVITPADMARAGKAIVIAGRRSADDPLWPTTDYLSRMGYNALLYRGYAKENVRFLSPVAGRDVDGNGTADDIAGETLYATVSATFTNWVRGGGDLFVYLVDHGGDSSGAGYFRLNATETLTASDLDAWLDALQDATSNAVTVVIDCCYAGSFVDELAYHGAARRTVIAACGTNEPTYFVSGGLVSFSDAFFSGLLMGLDVSQCFGLARQAMQVYQTAMMDDDGDGAYTPGADGLASAGVKVGLSFVAGRDIPQIGSVCGNWTLDGGGTSALLWAGDVVSGNPIQRVWCLIVPPGHNPDPANPVADVPQLEMAYDAGLGRYQGTFGGFSRRGTYKVEYYAADIWGGKALPRQSYVTQNGYDERLLIVAGGETNDSSWSAVDTLGALAWHTARGRWLAPSSIRYLTAHSAQDLDRDGTNDVQGAATLAALGDAITNWASGTDKMTIYLVGTESNGAFRLNAGETLTAPVLDAWMDTYQASNGAVQVVLEFANAGSWLPTLVPVAGKGRTCMASSKAGQVNITANKGFVSFSQYFWVDIFNGYSLGQAFLRARDAIRGATGRLRQEAQMDDNGDGVSNVRDGALAHQQYIGSAYVTGADTPSIGAVMPAATLAGTDEVTLWAQGVTAMAGVSNVWCVLTPPDFVGAGDLPQTNLAWNAGLGRYEAGSPRLSEPGTYTLTFLSQDNAGQLSSAVQSTLDVGDAYESDDAPEQASLFDVGRTQSHGLTASNDVDWVKFYATPDQFFQIDAFQTGTNAHLRLEVYSELADGSLTNLDWLTVAMAAGQTSVWTSVDLKADKELVAGFYYVKVSSVDPDGYGTDSTYGLKIWIPTGSGSLIVVALDKLNANAAPPGAQAVIEGVCTQAFAGVNSLTFDNLTNSAYTARVVVAAGYVPEEDPRQPGQVANTGSVWYGNPKVVAVGNVQVVVFQFVPVVQAQGTARDAWSGAWLDGAGLQFRATSGSISGLWYSAWPTTNYASPWTTRSDGSLPTNVWLPAVNWDLTVMCSGYSNAVMHRAIAGALPGAVTNLGMLWLTPLDTNGNGVADSWETKYFPGQALVLTNDADRDGMDNGNEYRCGTDPTSSNSVLRLDGGAAGTNGVTLVWPVASGRNYRILGADRLVPADWPLTLGPWTATNGQSLMRWTDDGAGQGPLRFYRVEVVPP